MAWLTGWQYRKKITISGSSGAGTNYQVLLKVGESSGATGAHFHVEEHSANFPSGKNNSGDLRITSSDGQTLLDFWVEKVEGTSPNRVAWCWVKVLEDLGTNRDIFCYDKDTEVLTEEGWILIKDLVESRKMVKIATLNPETDKVEYHFPSKFFKVRFKGELLRFIQKTIDCLVTPNHRLYVKPSWKINGSGKPNLRPYSLLRADNVPKNIYFRRDFPYEGKEKDFFEIPEYTVTCGNKKWTRKKKKYPMDAFLKFFGIWIAEGNIRKNGVIVINQKIKQNVKPIMDAIKELGYKSSYYEKSGIIYFCDKQLASWLQQFGHSYDKFIPKELKNLSKRQLKLLLDFLLLGDGGKKNNEYIYYATRSFKLANDVQEIALKIGYLATLSIRKDGMFIVNLGKKWKNVVVKKREKVFYDDYVYCVEVPNHIIYVRRNGKSYWCGNCYYGNPSASNVSNGEATFLFFDDFDVFNNSKWVIQTGHYSISDSKIYVGDNINDEDIIRTVNNIANKNVRLVSYATIYKDPLASSLLGFDRYNGPTIQWGWDNSTIVLRVNNPYNSTARYAATDLSANPTTGLWEIQWYSDGTSKLYYNNTLKATQTYPSSNSGMVKLYMQSYYANVYVIVDYLFVAKFVSPEPSFNSAGPEEMLIPASSRRLIIAST